MRRLRVFIVDDSVLFRSQITLALQTSTEIEIVGSASNGKLAIEKMPVFKPDVLVMDVEMPVMDGVTTLQELRKAGNQIPVLLFSSLSKAGVEKTLSTLHLGLVDFVGKPSADVASSSTEKIREALLQKLFHFRDELLLKEARSKPKSVSAGGSPTPFLWETFKPEILVIASSTGGPMALETLFGCLTSALPVPILIAQHMPPVFTQALAERLGKISKKNAGEAKHGDLLRPNEIYVAPGNFHLALSGTPHACQIVVHQEPHRNAVRPAADFLFEAAATIFKKRVLAVVLTGMGKDGLVGSIAVKQAGGAVMIQDRGSSVVFGMPGAVFDAGQYDWMGSPKELADKILSVFNVVGSHVA